MVITVVFLKLTIDSQNEIIKINEEIAETWRNKYFNCLSTDKHYDNNVHRHKKIEIRN
jgi:peptide deformylase